MQDTYVPLEALSSKKKALKKMHVVSQKLKLNLCCTCTYWNSFFQILKKKCLYMHFVRFLSYIKDLKICNELDIKLSGLIIACS